MAEAFVKADLHLILFNILYRDVKTDVDLSLSLPPSAPNSVAGTPLNDNTEGQPLFSVGGVRGPSRVVDDSDNAATSEEKDCELYG